jgi:hypothetical protein
MFLKRLFKLFIFQLKLVRQFKYHLEDGSTIIVAINH